MKHFALAFLSLTALAALTTLPAGCKPDHDGGNTGTPPDDNPPAQTVCPGDDEVRYVSDDPEVCKQVRFACDEAAGESLYTDSECGCGCTLPDCEEASADLTYVSHDPDQCAAIRFVCEVGMDAWFSDCGCGCARAEPVAPRCGGIMGKTCDEGFYCSFDPATNCGSGDQMGTCLEVPDVCYQIYKPVCGCDGTTYPNDCHAAGAGVSIAHDGACVSTPVGN